MDITALKAVICELRKEIQPSRFEKAQQPDPHTLQIGFRTLNELIWLELSWKAEAARLVKIPSPSRIDGASTLAKQVQSCLGQKALIDIQQKDFDRVVEFRLALRPGAPIERTLVIELMGRHSNFLLLNEDHKVITLGRQVKVSQSRIRPISTGDKYIPPPPLKGIKPNKNEEIECWKKRLCLIPTSLRKALQESYQGISPTLALQLANDDPVIAKKVLELSVLEITNEHWEKLYKRWCSWLTKIEKGVFKLSFDGPTAYKVWDTEGIEDFSPSDSICLSLGKYYRDNLDHQAINNFSKKLLQKLDFSLKNERISLKKQKELLRKTSESSSLKEEADKILSQPLPTRESITKAQKLYQKAKKLRRSVESLNKRCKYHQERIHFLENIQIYLDELITNQWEDSQTKLQRLEDLNVEFLTLLTKAKQSKNSRKNQNNQKQKALEIKSPRGLLIQIGRNHRQNLLISLKESKSGDLWFHAQECPGSHVVLKSSEALAEESDLQLASDFAAYFSKAKANKKVAVVVAPTQSLQRIGDASTGTVRHREGSVRWAKPERAENYISEKELFNS